MRRARFPLTRHAWRLVCTLALGLLLQGCVTYYYPPERGANADLYFAGGSSGHGGSVASAGHYGYTPWMPSYLQYHTYHTDILYLSQARYYPWYGWHYPYYTSAYAGPPCGAYWAPWRDRGYCSYYPYYHGPSHPAHYRSANIRTSSSLADYPDADELLYRPGDLPTQRWRDEQAGRGERPPNDFEDVLGVPSPAYQPPTQTVRRSGSTTRTGSPTTIRSRGVTKPGLMRPHDGQPVSGLRPVSPVVTTRPVTRPTPGSVSSARSVNPTTVRSSGAPKPGLMRPHERQPVRVSRPVSPAVSNRPASGPAQRVSNTPRVQAPRSAPRRATPVSRSRVRTNHSVSDSSSDR